MRAGILNELILIEELEIIKNEYGEEQTNRYKPKIRTRAEVRYNNGNRISENNEIFFAYDVNFTTRIYHNVTELDRIIWDKKPYRILAIEKNRQYQLMNIKCELINE